MMCKCDWLGLACWQRWQSDGLQKGGKWEIGGEGKRVSEKTEGWWWKRRPRRVAAAAKVDGQLYRPISVNQR